MTSLILFPFVQWLMTALFFFTVARPLFMIYNRSFYTESIGKENWVEILKRGFRTDTIIASYITAIPFLLTVLYAIFQFFSLSIILHIWYVLTSLLVSLIVIADAAVYKFWQMKIDSSALVYLKSLKGVFASVSNSYVVVGLLAVCALASFFYLFQLTAIRCITPYSTNSIWIKLTITLYFLIISGVLFVIIRGWGIRPQNPSITYFSNVLYFNHCALNPIYNFIYSLTLKNNFSTQFRSFSEEECDAIMRPLFPRYGKPQLELLNTKEPNIITIIWESAGARFFDVIGGEKNITPNFHNLCEEGVLFTRCDAGSWRTDRGLVCILSGYLAQPTTSIIRMEKKTKKLPALPRRFKELGYETTALHGGDLNIFHKSSYYLNVGHDRILSQKDFPKTIQTCKWGIHDGEMFKWLFEDVLDKAHRRARFFTTFQTLSSHENWNVPYDKIKNRKVENSFAYVDHCLGEFVKKLKRTKAWKDLLIIIVADHGCNDGASLPREQYVHIPLLMIGGAVKKHRKIDTIMSQTDIASTLLGQLGMPHDEFVFSRDVLADTYKKQFSFHDYPNGFLIRTEEGVTDYDNNMATAIIGKSEKREKMGKAILQKLYEDLDKL